MARVKEDMTGWIMSEHGVPDSKLTVVCQIENNAESRKYHSRWLCKCSCGNPNLVSVLGYNLKNGSVKSCGCLKKEQNTIKFKKENSYYFTQEYGVILSTNTNEEIYFDLDDADKILQHTWYKDTEGYPATNICNDHIRMHTLLGYTYPDHHDRNKLNNRRENLVPCTEQENARNKSIPSNNTSGVIGVSWSKQCQNWESYIVINRQKIHLGRFDNKDDAIKARLIAEKKYFGDFAPQKHLYEKYNIS